MKTCSDKVEKTECFVGQLVPWGTKRKTIEDVAARDAEENRGGK